MNYNLSLELKKIMGKMELRNFLYYTGSHPKDQIKKL